MLAEPTSPGGVFFGSTITLKLQLVALPEGSVAVQLTVLGPSGKFDPLGGLQLIVTEQLSLAAGFGNVVTLPEQIEGSGRVLMLAGVVIVGLIRSLTVTVKVQLVVLLRVSVAVQVTAVVPTAKVEPDAGVQVVVTGPQQGLLAVTVHFTTSEQEVVLVEISPGQLTEGGTYRL